MVKTEVYADILIAVNIITDYFLLKATAFFGKENAGAWRLLAGSAIGGASSLVIFFDKIGAVADVLIKISVSALMVLAAFGYKNKKRFMRLTALLFAVSFAFAGGMAAIWYIFRPHGMFVYNSVVYFDISALMLVIFSAAGYLVSCLLTKLFKANAKTSEKCQIEVYYKNMKMNLTAIIDSGNSLTDIFGNSEIIITEKSAVEKSGIASDRSRYRAIPCNTVSGTAILDGYRFDKATIHTKNCDRELLNPILAVSRNGIDGEYNAIINPEAVL